MNEGDVDDITEVSRAEDVRAQGKESSLSLESFNVLGPRERIILREGYYPRSSVQQFMDILDGKNPSNTVNIVDASQYPCTSYAEGRVQELALGHDNAGLCTMNEGEMMETLLNEWQPGDQPEDEHTTHKEKCPSVSREDKRFADVLAEQPSDYNTNMNSGQSPSHESDAHMRNTLLSGGMRMKIISKSSGYPEYFVKSTLKGKGVLYRGPIAGVAATTPSTTSHPPMNVREKSATPYTHCTAGLDIGSSQESVNDGVSLREWMKSGMSKSRKIDSLFIFKQILDLVYYFHSDGKVLVDLRPSCFRLLPSREVKYCGRLSGLMEMQRSIMDKDVQKSQALKRPLEYGMSPNFNFGAKHQKLTDTVKPINTKSQFQFGYGLKTVTNYIYPNLAAPGASGYELGYHSNADSKTQGNSSNLNLPSSAGQHVFSVVDQLEENWYRSPEELLGKGCTCSSNVYCLGIFLFELLSNFDSGKMHNAAMFDLRHRILPPNFLSENPKEAGFCLWLLHPEPSLRPTARDVLQSDLVRGFQISDEDKKSSSIQEDEGESELLLHFLMSMEEQKKKHASKLVEDLGRIETDIKELEKRRLLNKSTNLSCSYKDFLYARYGHSDLVSDKGDLRFLKNFAQLESAYFSTRSQIEVSVDNSLIRGDRDMLKNQENWYSNEKEVEPFDTTGAFFDGLCKYARYSKLQVRGTIRSRDITNSTNVICSLSFDRDEDYFATAGVSKKIKIFDFQALCDSYVDIHYPMIEMLNKSRLSCVCWNNYIRNYLASTDYDGIVKLWDASTGQAFSQYTDHDKRTWSVDFSRLDPTKFASGSDDCSVKLWSINERNCLHTIRNIANVCCVEFSPHSSHLLAFGTADYKIYCYDLRNANGPWCILGGHEKAVSYVKFVDSETLVSASTDNTLKLWDLNKSSSVGLSTNACTLTLGGHTNQKNFVGLSVADGYIACGSETNEVYTYYKSLPMPITSHKFGSIDPISGKETDNDNGQFVSSVCWKGKSNEIVAANSSGCIKVLKMV